MLFLSELHTHKCGPAFSQMWSAYNVGAPGHFAGTLMTKTFKTLRPQTLNPKPQSP